MCNSSAEPVKDSGTSFSFTIESPTASIWVVVVSDTTFLTNGKARSCLSSSCIFFKNSVSTTVVYFRWMPIRSGTESPNIFAISASAIRAGSLSGIKRKLLLSNRIRGSCTAKKSVMPRIIPKIMRGCLYSLLTNMFFRFISAYFDKRKYSQVSLKDRVAFRGSRRHEQVARLPAIVKCPNTILPLEYSQGYALPCRIDEPVPVFITSIF